MQLSERLSSLKLYVKAVHTLHCPGQLPASSLSLSPHCIACWHAARQGQSALPILLVSGIPLNCGTRHPHDLWLQGQSALLGTSGLGQGGLCIVWARLCKWSDDHLEMTICFQLALVHVSSAH